MRETVGLPEYATSTQRNPEVAMGTILSKNMWTSNPGYVIRDGSHMASSAHQDYVWDQEAVSSGKTRV